MIYLSPLSWGLTHWGRVTHICVSKLTIIGSDNGLSPGRRQAIVWTNAGTLLIWTLGTNFSEISSEIHAFSFKKMHLIRSSAKWRPFCLGLKTQCACACVWTYAIRSVSLQTKDVMFIYTEHKQRTIELLVNFWCDRQRIIHYTISPHSYMIIFMVLVSAYDNGSRLLLINMLPH